MNNSDVVESKGRWAIAALGVHLLSSLLWPVGARRVAAMAQIRERFDPVLLKSSRQRLVSLYRQRRATLAGVTATDDHATDVVRSAFRCVGERLADGITSLRSEHGDGHMFDSIGGSLLHMHINRVLRAPSRLEELAIYDALNLCYRVRSVAAGR